MIKINKYITILLFLSILFCDYSWHSSIIPYSPLNNIKKNQYKVYNYGEFIGNAIASVGRSITKTEIYGEHTEISYCLAWVLDGHPLSDDPETFYKNKKYIIWENYQIKFLESGQQISDRESFLEPGIITDLDSGKTWMINDMDLGEWKKIIIKYAAGDFRILVISKKNGLIADESYDPDGSPRYSFVLFKVLK